MRQIWKGFTVLMLASLGTGIASASTLTYTFTGIVTNVQGSFTTQAAIGDTITGTYTFDYAAAIPSQSSGTPGDGSPPNGPGWQSYSNYAGGSFPAGASLSDNLVFTSTAQVVGTTVSYATTAPGPGNNIGSHAVGFDNGGSEFAASEIANQATGLTNSSFGIGGITPGQVFDANGGPVLPASLPYGSGSGDFQVQVGAIDSVISYDITSISPPSPVPLPASAWLMLSGIIGLGVMTRRRRTA
jgi:hypothetical protein